MASDTIHLPWTLHVPNIISTFTDLYENQMFADVTFVSENNVHFSAHKSVLSVCSPVLKNILSNHSEAHTVIFLKEVQEQVLIVMLQFLYLGEVNVERKNIGKFLEVAKELGIHDIQFVNTSAIVNDMKYDLNMIEQERYEDTSCKDVLNEKPREEISSNDNKMHACSECVLTFQSSLKLKRHRKRKHEESLIPCNSCAYNATDSSSLKKHQQAFHEGIRHPCNHCEYKAAFKCSLKIHYLSQHKDITFPCNECDFQGSTPSNLKTHEKSKHKKSIDKIPYICGTCERLFVSMSKLNEHVQSLHEGIKYDCNNCKYQASNTRILKRHKKAIHEGLRHPCDQCDYQGYDKSNLRIHILNKHEDFKYSCNFCEYKATTQYSLKVHKQAKHEGVCYSCDQCDFQTYWLPSFQTHIKNEHY